jgi:hypothetical protein
MTVNKKTYFFLSVISFMTVIYLIVFLIVDIPNSLYGFNHTADALAILKASRNLYHGFVFDAERTYLLPLIFGIPHLFNVPETFLYYFILVIHYLSCLLCVTLMFSVLKTFISRRLAMLACFVFSLSISYYLFSFYALTENFFILALMVSLYFFNSYICRREIKYLAFSALFIFVSSVIRPITLPLCILILLGWIVYTIKITSISKSRLLFVLCFFVFTLGIQFGGIYKDYNRFDFSLAGRKSLYKYLGSFAESLNTGEAIELVQARREQKLMDEARKAHACDSMAVVNKYIDQVFKKDVSSNLKNLCRAYVYTLYSNATSGFQGYTGMKGAGIIYSITKYQNIFYVLIFLFIIVFVIYKFMHKQCKAFVKSKETKIILFCLILNLTNWMLSGMVYWQGDRYNVVMIPFTVISFILIISIFVRKQNPRSI